MGRRRERAFQWVIRGGFLEEVAFKLFAEIQLFIIFSLFHVTPLTTFLFREPVLI